MAWQSGDYFGGAILGQRFRLIEPAILDVDADGSIQATTDGLLVLRYSFDFNGQALTSGAVGSGCNRCDAATIESYLAGLDTTLDVDGNGDVEALTDGLLFLRYLFGFTDSVLTDGALAADCERCDGIAISSYFQTLD